MQLLRMLRIQLLLFWLAVVVIASENDGSGSGSSNGGVILELNPDNYQILTKNKNVFIMFYDPNCEHCQKLAPIWEQLVNNWQDHNLVLLAKVNCRQSRILENWCSDQFHIYGLPSLLFGEPSHNGIYLHSYGDDKTYTALNTFVENELSQKRLCSPGQMEYCEPHVQERLKAFWKLSAEELEQQIRDKEDAMHIAQRNFKLEFDRMQKIYDESERKHKETTEQIKTNIETMQTILQAKQ